MNSYKSTSGLEIHAELKTRRAMFVISKNRLLLAAILFCLSLGIIFFTNSARAEEGMATSTPFRGGELEITGGDDSFSFTNNLAIAGTAVTQGRLADIGRKLARTSDGLLHAAYIHSDGIFNQVYYSYSSDNGQTWVEEQITTASRNHGYPVIAVDTNNFIHLAWVYCQEPSGPGKTCTVQYRLKTTGWQNIEDVLTGYLYAPAIAIDSQDNVHLAVRGYNPGAWNCDDLKYKKGTALGWGPTEKVSSICWATQPAISIDQNDNVHIAYGHSPAAYYNLVYRKRTLLVWEPEQEFEVPNGNGDSPSASLAVDNNNFLHLAWQWKQPGVTQYAIKYQKFTTTWQPVENLTGTTSHSQIAPTIAADSKNDLHLLWSGRHAGSPAQYQIRHLNYAASWQPIENLTSGLIDQLSSALIFALWPQINTIRPNIPQTGYAFLWNDGPVVKFFKSPDLVWEVSPQPPLNEAAADLAKQLVNSAYLFGGKGWDYNLSEFVAPDIAKTGYTFWNQASSTIAFGAGVDCSGLIMWSYDRSFDPQKPRFNNFVKYEGADGQYHNNTTSTTESELRPGDVMFFNNDADPEIDHVAMYVGDSGGFDVVNAANTDLGIVGRLKDNLKQPSTGFVAFKRVVSAPPPAVLATANSPVDLILTDPNGFTITPTTIVPSDVEFLREIPGVLYYSEMERGADGNPIDRVYSPVFKTGDYTIQVFSTSGTPPTATYTLDFSVGDQTITLAQDVPVSQIPSQGYGVTRSETGTVHSFIPVAIDIKPGSFPNSINLGSNGVVPVAIFGSATFDVHQIDPTTVKLANASVQLKGNGQPMASYSDVNGDGFTDVVVQVSTEALQLTSSDVRADLDGQLTSGVVIKGSDSVRIVP